MSITLSLSSKSSVTSKQRFGNHQGWAEYDKYTYLIWYGIILSVIVAFEIIAIEEAAAAAAVVVTTVTASVELTAITSTAAYFALYVVPTRMLLARGNLTIKHYDIVDVDHAQEFEFNELVSYVFKGRKYRQLVHERRHEGIPDSFVGEILFRRYLERLQISANCL